MRREERWSTPSDLAEYAFCPRAHHYRLHGEAPTSRSAEAGETYHARRLSAERWRAEHRSAPWLAVLAGLVAIALAAAWLIR